MRFARWKARTALNIRATTLLIARVNMLLGEPNPPTYCIFDWHEKNKLSYANRITRMRMK